MWDIQIGCPGDFVQSFREGLSDKVTCEQRQLWGQNIRQGAGRHIV